MIITLEHDSEPPNAMLILLFINVLIVLSSKRYARVPPRLNLAYPY
jgi:hypothetical protein